VAAVIKGREKWRRGGGKEKRGWRGHWDKEDCEEFRRGLKLEEEEEFIEEDLKEMEERIKKALSGGEGKREKREEGMVGCRI